MKVMNPSSHNKMGAPTPTEKANKKSNPPTHAPPVRKWSHVNFDRFITTVQSLERDDDLKRATARKVSTVSHINTSTNTTAPVTPSDSESLMEKGQSSRSTSALPSRSAITSASTLNSLATLSYSEEDEKEYPTHKRKSFVMMGRRPMAFVSMTSNATSATTNVTASSSTSKQTSTIPSSISTLNKNPTQELLKDSEEKKNEPEAPTARTRVFRIYKPGVGRTSIVLSVGKKFATEEAEKIFEASKIRTKTYKEWRKAAAAQLPSATGGPPIEHLKDVVAAIPDLQKETDPKELQKAINRLSLESSDIKTLSLPPAKKDFKRILKTGRNYTKVRKVNNAPNNNVREEVQVQRPAVADQIDDDDDDDDGNDSSVLDEDRLLELERYQAGVDIKAKITALRTLTDKLSHKRKIRQKLVELATGFTVLDEEDIPIKEHLLYLLEHMGEMAHDALHFVLIWDKQIREINGKFGTVVANYFVWVRKMVALEVLAFTLTNAIIIIPQIVEQSQETKVARPHIPFHVADLINGERYFEYSYLYYSGYHNRNEDSSNPFNNPAFRFLFCMLIMFLIFTYFIFSRLTKYYHSIRLESTVSGVANMRHFKSIICGWDFNCGDVKSKGYLHKTIRRELKMLADTSHETGKTLLDFEAEKKKILGYAVKRFGLFWGPWAIHIVGNFLIFGACAFMGIILFELCQLKLYYYVECVPYRDDHKVRVLDEPILCPKGDLFLYTWILSLPALFASITTLLLTKFIVVVGESESWNTPERKIYGTMIRAGVFNFTNIIVFYSFWISSKEVLTANGFTAETIFGKELYRLVVIQGVTDVFLNLVVKGVYHLIWRKSENYKKSEFRTEYGTLNMFFIHSVSRISILFCPPMSFFVILRLVVDYYQNKFSLHHLSCQEGYFAHASHVYAPFLLTFFILCYLITSFMNVFYLTDTVPSSFAGPFVRYNISYDQVLADLLAKKSKVHWLKHLSEPVLLYTFMSILGALAYFVRQWALSYEPIAVTLNDQISLERGDRDLLLKAIFEIGKVTEETANTTHDPTKLSSKIKRVAIASTAFKTAMSDGEETEEEDITDQHIAELIHRVQRRKSLDLTGQIRSSGGGRLSANAQKHHTEHVEAMVAMIVDERKKRGGMSVDDLSVKMELSETSMAMVKNAEERNIPSSSKDDHHPNNVTHPSPQQQQRSQSPHPQQQHHQNPPPHQPLQRQPRKTWGYFTRNTTQSANLARQNRNAKGYTKNPYSSVNRNRK